MSKANFLEGEVHLNISRKAKNNIAGYLFIMPNLIGFIVFTAFAVVFSLIISFTDYDMVSPLNEIKFIGIINYIDIFSDKWFTASIINNAYFLLFIPLQILLALICAVILNGKIIGRKLLRTVFYLPYITSFVAISLVWFQLLHPTQGVVNSLLMHFGISNPPKWFGSSYWVKPAIVAMMTWQGLGYNMILYLAGLQGVPKDLYEASEIDGATGIRKFLHITLPMVSPVTFFILIMSVINNFIMWSNIQILTTGGPGSASMVIGYDIYKNAFTYYKMGYASSEAWVLFVIILVITLIQWRGQKKWVNYI
jgi:ABC-type sugar transport systems, permease components